MRNAGLEEAQAGIKIAREISVTADVKMALPLWQKAKTKETIDESERRE